MKLFWIAGALTLLGTTAFADTIYVSNELGTTISRIAQNGTITTFAGGMNGPDGLAYRDGFLYAANFDGNRISRIDSAGTVTTFVSNAFNSPAGLIFDGAGNLYVSNWDGNRISRVTPGGVVSTFATGFSQPDGMLFESNGSGNLLVGDFITHRINRVSPAGVVTPWLTTGLNRPTALAYNAAGDLFISNWGNGGNGEAFVVRVTPEGLMSTFATGFTRVFGIAFDSTGDLFVSNWSLGTIDRVTPGGQVFPFASGFNGPTFMHMVPVPEPALLLGAAAAGWWLVRRRRLSRHARAGSIGSLS